MKELFAIVESYSRGQGASLHTGEDWLHVATVKKNTSAQPPQVVCKPSGYFRVLGFHFIASVSIVKCDINRCSNTFLKDLISWNVWHLQFNK